MFKKIKTVIKNFVQKVAQKVKSSVKSVLSHIRNNWRVYVTALAVILVLTLTVLAFVEDRRLSSALAKSRSDLAKRSADLAKTIAHHEAVDLELDRILLDPELGDAWNMAVATIQGIIGKAEASLV